MKVILLGTACASSGIERDNTYLLFQQFESCSLIDVGGNPLGKLKKMNIPTNHIKRVIFTHFHIDHIYGLPSLLWGMWIDGRREHLDIYCTEEKKEWLEDFLRLLQMELWPALFEIHILTFDWEKPSQIWHDDELSLSVFPSSHGAVPTVGIQAIYQEKVVVYSSDTTLNQSFNDYSKIDLLIHEATTASTNLGSHSNLEAMVNYYNFDVVEKLVLVHLKDDEPYDEILMKLPSKVRNQITIGYDSMSISLVE